MSTNGGASTTGRRLFLCCEKRLKQSAVGMIGGKGVSAAVVGKTIDAGGVKPPGPEAHQKPAAQWCWSAGGLAGITPPA